MLEEAQTESKKESKNPLNTEGRKQNEWKTEEIGEE